MKVDISALLGGDIYALLRERSAKRRARFSKERDDERALKERQRCLTQAAAGARHPAEVLARAAVAERDPRQGRSRARAANAARDGATASLRAARA